MLRLRYLSMERLSSMSIKEKTDLIIDYSKNNEIIIIDGRLKSREEAELIRTTMKNLSNDFEVFHGIEMASLYNTMPKKKKLNSFFQKKSCGITIIGPASIISEFNQYQDYLEINIKK